MEINIFDSEFNLITFYSKCESDDVFKFFLRTESNTKTIITNRTSLFYTKDYSDFDTIKFIINEQDIIHGLDGLKDETIIIDYYLSFISTTSDLRRFFNIMHNISYEQNIKFIFITQAYRGVRGNYVIKNEIMYNMSNVFRYNNNIITIVKSRYLSYKNNTIDIKKYNNHIRRKKLKNII